MARIPESLIEQVRERTDIVQIIGRYVTLKASGSQFTGLCPFHDEKTPSFQVSPSKQVFYCFGCQAGGNVFSFLMRLNGLEFRETVETLAREMGIEIPDSAGEQGSGKTAALFHVNDAALEFFRSALRGRDGEPARRHLAERGIPEDLIERFQLGYAPPGWDGLIQALRAGRQSSAAAVEVGLIKARDTSAGYYDAFRDRVIFPILDPSGRVSAFGGRALSDDGPKYINSSESSIYQKSRVLFGLPQALDAIRQRGRAVVVEGYFDVLALHRAGLSEAVAPCGTSLTADHARRLHRYAREVVLLFDGDAAGERAARRSLGVLLSQGLRVRAAFLPQGEDPDSLVRTRGGAALRSCVEAARPLLDELIERALKERGGDHAWDAADAWQDVGPFIQAIHDPVEQAAYTRKLSSYLELPPEALARALVPAESSGEWERTEAAPELHLDPILSAFLANLFGFPELSRHLERVQSDWIPEGIDRDVFSVASEALRSHGQAAVSHMLSPDDVRLGGPARAAIARVAALDPPANVEVAERAANDCVAQLEKRILEARIREIKQRLHNGDDADFEALQACNQRRNELVSSLAQAPSP